MGGVPAVYDYCVQDERAGVEERAEHAAFFRLLRQAAGVTARDWVMAEDDERIRIHRRGLWRLVWAAGWRVPLWRKLAGYARAAVLMIGARALGITHDWTGTL
jgi:hypothetical protein